MLSWIVLILALAIFALLGMWLFSSVFGRGEAVPPMERTADVKAANREAVEDGRYGDIQLEVVHRGYRMDQVDALIAQLTGTEYVEPGTGTSSADAEAARKRVDSTEEVLVIEGEPTHGSNETAHR